METTIEETPKKNKGFTLIELLIVIVILGVLATVTVLAVRGITDRGEENACSADKKTLETAAEAAFAQNNTYPADEDALVSGGFIAGPSSKYQYTGTGTSYSIIPQPFVAGTATTPEIQASSCT